VRRAGGAWAAGLVLAALAVALGVERAVAGAHVAVGLGLAACLLLIARASGLTTADLGLARPTWPAGLRWGAAAAAVVATAYAVGWLVPPLRAALPQATGDLEGGTLATILVVIPLGTVLPEELAFRGVLLSLLGRRLETRSAVLWSSGLFGLWHVPPSLGGGAANAAMADVVGGVAGGLGMRVVATVAFTALAGLALCWLRLRSDSLLAPFLAHWTVNGLGVIVTLLA
jgi:membrane protease YdiL (CAAX protease family)